MFIRRLELHHFRNLTEVILSPSPSINLVIGPNGSGKTSLLEAIYFLSLGRSFRSHLSKRIIQHGFEQFSLYSLIDVAGDALPLGIEKDRNNETRIRFNQNTIHSTVELAKILPCLLINCDSFDLLMEGPKVRRKFFDWGMFHVKHQFIETWQNYHKVLKHRNALIKANAATANIKVWNASLVKYGLQLHQMRQEFLDLVLEKITNYIGQYFQGFSFHIRYQPGWDIEENLVELLENNLARDRQLGFTSKGPHRFDFVMTINKVPVKDILSRGQLKLFICLLYLSMHQIVAEQTEKHCILLLDDLPAELDESALKIVLDEISALQSQVFLSAIQSPIYFEQQKKEFKMFHVEHGIIK